LVWHNRRPFDLVMLIWSDQIEPINRTIRGHVIESCPKTQKVVTERGERWMMLVEGMGSKEKEIT